MNKAPMPSGRELILLGFERWKKYVEERGNRPIKKSLTDFYAEAFDQAIGREHLR